MKSVLPCVNNSDELNSECESKPKDINESTYIYIFNSTIERF